MNSEYKAVLQSVEDELPFQITWYDALESLLSIDSVLVSCEEQLDKVDLGVNYESQEAKLDKALTDRGYIEKYLENVQDYVLTNLDEKLYKWFNNGPTEAISTISLDDYSTEDQKSEIYCNYIKFTDFMGASGDGAFIEANKKAYVSEFEDIFANQYQSYKEMGCLSDEVELDEYIDAIVMQGSFNHQMDKPVESFVSGVLDVTIIKPLIESVIGVDLITHDDLNGLERGMKGVSALLSIYATGTVLLGTNVSKIGTQEVLAYTAKTMVVDSSAQLTALGVQKIGERCDLPVAITIILSFISGIVVSTKVDGIKIQGKNVSKKIDPPSGNVDKIKDAGIITEGSVGSIESGKYSSLRELMSPEEIARYDAYWNKVAGEKLTSVGNQKAFEILETQSKKSAGPCLSTIYDPELDNFYFGQNFKSGNKMGKVEYINWLNNDADIIIKERTDLYQYEIDNEIVKIQNPCHDDRLAAHSEIRALDQALAARRELGYTVNEETLKELYLYNIDLTELYKNNIIIPKPRCENCSRLTDGINTVIHN